MDIQYIVIDFKKGVYYIPVVKFYQEQLRPNSWNTKPERLVIIIGKSLFFVPL